MHIYFFFYYSAKLFSGKVRSDGLVSTMKLYGLWTPTAWVLVPSLLLISSRTLTYLCLSILVYRMGYENANLIRLL